MGFWIAAGLIGYATLGAYAGVYGGHFRCYGLLLRHLCSVVMVVRNEGQVVETKLQNLLSIDYPELNRRGFGHGTKSILPEYAREARVGSTADADVPREGCSPERFTGAGAGRDPGLYPPTRLRECRCASGELIVGDPSTAKAGKVPLCIVGLKN